MKTLGIFAKQPVPGRVKTRLAESWGAVRASEFYAAMLLDLLDRCSDLADVRQVGYTPSTAESQQWFQAFVPATYEQWPQPDGDLGSRITSFFGDHLHASTDRVVLIGSDSPSIPRTYIEQAFELLETCDCCLGPAADGGYYLIGLSGRAARWQRLFEEIPWSSARVMSETVLRLTEIRLSLALLPVWYDVDSAEDVCMLTGHLQALTAANESIDLPRTRRALASISDPSRH